MAQSAGLREPAKEEARRHRATNPRTNRRTTKFQLGSFETQEGIRISQGIVNREKHEDNEVVPKTTKESVGDRLINRIRVKSCHTMKDIEQIKHDGNVLPSSRKCAVDRRRVIKPVV